MPSQVHHEGGLLLEEVIQLISIISFHYFVFYYKFTSPYILKLLYSVVHIIYDLSHSLLSYV